MEVSGKTEGCVCVCPPGPISPAVDAPGQVVITVVAPRVVKEVSSGAKAAAVDHASWSLWRGGEKENG